MFHRDEKSFPPRFVNRKEEDKLKEFQVVLNKDVTLYILEKHDITQIIIKKELLDYQFEMLASEAPLKTPLFGGELLPFEYVVAEKAIIEQEIFPLDQIIKNVFGNQYDLKLKAIRLCIGPDENEYLTIDESDLKEVDVTPTINGLKSFIQTNKKSVFGFTIRHYDSKKGNLVFCECELLGRIFNIKSFNIQILSNLSQRGLYMQKHHTGYGLHLYYILEINQFSDKIIQFFNELKIPIETIYLKRKSSIQNWRAIECELDLNNLKNYLQSQYTYLDHLDIQHILKTVSDNKFNFDFANMMADLLNRLKHDRVEVEDGLYKLEQEDFAAAAKVVVNYFGFNEQDLSLPANLDFNTIKKCIDKLDQYIH